MVTGEFVSEWIVCPACGLKHRAREEAVCPRCGAAYQPQGHPPGGAPPATSPAPAFPEAAPAPEEAAAAAAGDRAHSGGRRGRVPVAITLAVLVCAAAAVELKLRQAPDPLERTVATFQGGRITRGEVEEELRSLPPGLKRDYPGFLSQLTAALASRRVLAAEAEARGLGSALWRDQRERKLVRALLEAEGFRTPRTAAEARPHSRRFQALAEVKGLRFDQVALDLILLEPDGPVVPRPALEPPPLAEEAFFLESGRSCAGVIHADAGWYTGVCHHEEPLPRILLPADILYLESTYGPIEGFLHRFAFDGVRRVNARVPSASPGAEYAGDVLPSTAPEALRQYGLVLVDLEVSGSLTAEAAQRAFDRVATPFQHCEAWSRRLSRYSDKEATVVVELRVEAGKVVDGRVDDSGFIEPRPVVAASAAVDRAACLWPLKTYRLEGTGQVRYRFRATGP